MRPDDDLKLGKLVKKRGFRQDVVHGQDFIVVEWYSSVGEMIDGLMKNAFAGVDYSLVTLAGSTVALLLMNVWPFVALVATHGVTRALNGVSVVLIVLIFWISARYTAGVWATCWRFQRRPCSSSTSSGARAVAVVRGTVTWRGTAYRWPRCAPIGSDPGEC